MTTPDLIGDRPSAKRRQTTNYNTNVEFVRYGAPLGTLCAV